MSPKTSTTVLFKPPKVKCFTNLLLSPIIAKALRNSNDADIRVGLESTGHFSYNLLGFLLNKELPTFVFNPLQTNQFRKTLSLRKTKTDKVDARTIALMLLTKNGSETYSLQAYQNEELKSLTRYRFDKVNQRSKLTRRLNLFQVSASVLLASLKWKSVTFKVFLRQIKSWLLQVFHLQLINPANSLLKIS